MSLFYKELLLFSLTEKLCNVGEYSTPLININPNQECAAFETVPCDTQCTFDCSGEENSLVGVSRITCCDNGTFSSGLPTCARGEGDLNSASF